jgi:hypothetical protein
MNAPVLEVSGVYEHTVVWRAAMNLKTAGDLCHVVQCTKHQGLESTPSPPLPLAPQHKHKHTYDAWKSLRSLKVSVSMYLE